MRLFIQMLTKRIGRLYKKAKISIEEELNVHGKLSFKVVKCLSKSQQINTNT